MKNNKGFSLVELIVVIAIMAILAAVAIPTFSGFINKANISADDSYANDIKYACKMAFASEGEVTAVTVKGSKEAKWNTISVTVKDPSGVNTTTYTITNGDAVSYKVGSDDMEGDALECAKAAVDTIDSTYTFKTASYENAK